MSLKRNLIIEDTETSGLDPEDGCEVVEIFAKAINYWDLSDHHAGVFHAYIKPTRPDKAQKGALAVLGDGWAKANDEGLEPKVAWQKYHDWCASVNDGKSTTTRPIKIAHNMPFDSKFIRAGMKEHKIVTKGNFGWDFPWGFEFDSMSLLYFLFENDPTVDNLKLDTFLQKFGMKRKEGKVHTASEDVLFLADLVTRSMKFLREANRRMTIKRD